MGPSPPWRGPSSRSPEPRRPEGPPPRRRRPHKSKIFAKTFPKKAGKIMSRIYSEEWLCILDDCYSCFSLVLLRVDVGNLYFANPKSTHFLQNRSRPWPRPWPRRQPRRRPPWQQPCGGCGGRGGCGDGSEDLRFGGCGKKVGRCRMFLVVFGRFGPFSDGLGVLDRFRTICDVFSANCRNC